LPAFNELLAESALWIWKNEHTAPKILIFRIKTKGSSGFSVKSLKRGWIVATYFYSKVDIGLIMNGQIKRSLLGFSIGIAILDVVSAIPVSAQPTKPLTWQQHINLGGLQTGSPFLDQFKYDFDLPSEFRNGYTYQATRGTSQVGVYILKSGLASYPPIKAENRANGIDAKTAESYVEDGKAIALFWNLSNSGQNFANDKDIRFIQPGKGCYSILCLDAPFMSNAQIQEILLSKRPIGQKSKKTRKGFQDLPDGNYFYGANSNPYKVGTDYLIFKKVDRILTGMQYLAGSGSSSCFTGKVQDDAIIDATQAYIIFGNPSKWEFSRGGIVDFHSINTGKSDVKHNIGFEKVPDPASRLYKECLTVLADRVVATKPKAPTPSNSAPLPTTTKFPTQAEFDRVKKVASNNPGKTMSSSDRAQRQDFRSIWRKKNETIVPFIGAWETANGQQIYVYPSSQPRRVCIITQTDQKTQFNLGIASGRELRYAGDRGLYMTDPGRLDLLAARDSRSSSLSPIVAISGTANNLSTSDLAEMEQAKCITQLPAGQIAQAPSNQSSGSSATNTALWEPLNLGCTQNLKVAFGQTAPDYCRSLEADSGILFDRFEPAKRNANGSITLEFMAFNRGSADALIEIYDAQGKLKDIQIIDGNKPPTGLLKTGTDMFTRYPTSFFSRYPIGDIRRDLEKASIRDRVQGKDPNKVEVTIPTGGTAKITKSSDYAKLYNSVMLGLEVSQIGGDSGLTKVKTARELAIRFVKETGKTTATNIFTSEASAQAIFSLDFIDKNKLAGILQKFIAYSLTAKGKPLADAPLESTFVSALADVVVADSNETLEIALDRYISPGLGTVAKTARTAGDGMNTYARGIDLFNSFMIGEKGSITLINKASR
jgi:hypothetical protein